MKEVEKRKQKHGVDTEEKRSEYTIITPDGRALSLDSGQILPQKPVLVAFYEGDMASDEINNLLELQDKTVKRNRKER